MKAYISAGEESYPVYTLSSVNDAFHNFEVELPSEEVARIEKVIVEYEAVQHLLGSLKSRYVGPNPA